MNARQAARAAAERIVELEGVVARQAADIKDYNRIIVDMISGASPCTDCEEYEECQLDAKAGKGCSEWWLRYKKVTQPDVNGGGSDAGKGISESSAGG